MLCAHRAKDGRLPACAEACPMFAIYLGDLVEDIATNGQEVVKLSLFLAENSAFRLKEDLGTRPRVWYIPGHGQEYGHDLSEHRHPSKARSWQELGVDQEDHQEDQNKEGSDGRST
jgi:molybdopterin-containing oxidoreductase family iron-sulfur binding subunit